jgi:REP element-mobilizing transposase RayT
MKRSMRQVEGRNEYFAITACNDRASIVTVTGLFRIRSVYFSVACTCRDGLYYNAD